MADKKISAWPATSAPARTSVTVFDEASPLATKKYTISQILALAVAADISDLDTAVAALLAANAAPLAASLLDLPLGATPDPPDVGRALVYASAVHGIARLRLEGADAFVQTVCRDGYLICLNSTGSTIAKGKVVYVNGASGTSPTIALARANATGTTRALGFTAEAITDAGFGRVIFVGALDGLDTSTFTAGDILYLDAATAGMFTTTRPALPNLTQAIGVVLNVSSTTGSVYVGAPVVRGEETGTTGSSFSVGGNALTATDFLRLAGATSNVQAQIDAAVAAIALRALSSSLGTMATQNANAVTVTGGSVTGITDLAVADGGTGASTAAAARTNLGLGTAAVTDTGTSAGNVPVLGVGGVLNAAVLPALAITEVNVVASQAAMLALTAERGDIAIRSDLNKTFALSTDSPTTLADWKELLTPTDAVLSVAGRTGAVTLTAGDLTAVTASKALVSDASGFMSASSVTAAELGWLSGVTSAIQTQIAGKQASLGYTAESAANKDAASGYAGLSAGSKLAAAQLPVFIASGASHAVGAVPDPGASAGSAKFLREDATWQTPVAGVTIGDTIASATAKSVLYAGASGALAQDNANFSWDYTNHRLGIGLATPLYQAHLGGNAPRLQIGETTTNTSATLWLDTAADVTSDIYMTEAGGAHGTRIRNDAQFNYFRMYRRVSSAETKVLELDYVSGGFAVFDPVTVTSLATAYVSKSSAYTATSADSNLSADATSAAFQVTLPTAVGCTGRQYTIKRTNSGGNAVTVGTTSSQTIDGAASKSLDAQYSSVTVYSNGANWLIRGQLGTVT